MPFICDDITWKMIDDEDPYDKSRFVVVRKLHIKLSTEPWQFMDESTFTPDQIRRQLRKYGEIESIEMLSTIESAAHVTFVSEQSAYLVQLQHDYDRTRKQQPFQIQPANSWEQPKANFTEFESNANEQTSEMLKLNEDCLLYLFTFLDLDSMVNLSEVCQRFHRLLHQHSFQRIHELTVYNVNDTFSMPLAKMRRTLNCIGRHITDLKYTCNIYNDINRTKRFLDVLVQYIGSNLRRAKFFNSLICEENQIFTIAPILRNLESLEIHDMNYYLGTDIDFEELCPNLMELKLKMNMRLIQCCKPWARLQHLSILDNEFFSTMTFLSFVEKNPQLISFEFLVFDADIRLQAVGQHLTMLEKLTLDSVDANLGPWDFIHVKQLQQLNELNLLTLDYQHLRGIFDCLATITTLRRIDLNAYCSEDFDKNAIDYERSLIDLARNLTHLEEFSLKSIIITEKTLLEFLTFATQLRVMHIHWCFIKGISDTLILKVVDILKITRPNEQLCLYINPTDFIDIHVTRNDDVKQHLCISAKCKHFGF